MKGLFTEKLEYYKALLNTKEGWFEYLIGSAIWGFIIVNYKDAIYNKILEFLNFLPQGLILDYFSYLFFGLVLIPLGLAITFVLTQLFRVIFKHNHKIIK